MNLGFSNPASNVITKKYLNKDQWMLLSTSYLYQFRYYGKT